MTTITIAITTALAAAIPKATMARESAMTTYTHVIHDLDTIHGAGASEDAAWADYNDVMAKAGIDPSSMENVECSPCSPGVSSSVEQGGQPSWCEHGGVVMLRSERR